MRELCTCPPPNTTAPSCYVPAVTSVPASWTHVEICPHPSSRDRCHVAYTCVRSCEISGLLSPPSCTIGVPSEILIGVAFASACGIACHFQSSRPVKDSAFTLVLASSSTWVSDQCAALASALASALALALAFAGSC